MTRSIIRRVDWTISREESSPDPIHVFECTTCTDQGPADTDFEAARTWTFGHVGGHPSHTGFREIITRHWRMHAVDVGPVCPECNGHGDRVLPSASAATECAACEGSGGYVPAPACMACHDTGCAACRPPLSPSAPTPEYGAPSLPVLPARYAVEAGACMPILGPVDAGVVDRTERY